MNKRNKILVGCLALLFALSVGYALFSETITINGTATAKGNFNITATCTPGISDETGLTTEDLFLTPEGGYDLAQDSCTVTDNRVSLSAGLLYPGSGRYYTIKLTNSGSINATLDIENATEDYGVSNLVQKACEVSDDGIVSTNCSKTIVGNNGEYQLAYYNLGGFLNTKGEFCDAKGACVGNFVNNDTGEIIIKPGESVYYISGFEWDKDFENTSNKVNYKIDMSYDIKFIQATN